MKKYLLAFLVLASSALAQWPEKYGTAVTLYFPLYDVAGVILETAPAACVAGDVQFSEDGAAFGNTNNCFAHEGNGIYSLAMLNTEMQGAVVVITIVDQPAGTVWMDQVLVIPTHNDESAKYAMPFDGEEFLADIRTIIKGVVDDAPDAPTTTEFEADALSNNDGAVAIPTAADHFNGRIIVFTTGTLLGQATRIEDYDDDAGNAEFTVTALTSAPADDVEFVILPHFGGDVHKVQEGAESNTWHYLIIMVVLVCIICLLGYYRRSAR